MLYFVTGNKHKINSACLYLNPHNIFFEVKNIPLIEIQSTSIEQIAKHKAKEAFAQIKQPLIVKDDGWFIEALNGFPGAYMRYVNEWFSTDDFLRLLKGKTNKKVIFHEVVCYIDADQEKIFSGDIIGKFLNKPQGNAVPFMELSTFRRDRKSMAKAANEGLSEFDDQSVWNDFAKWYKNTFSSS